MQKIINNFSNGFWIKLHALANIQIYNKIDWIKYKGQ
jgi:hypothetical protein